VIASQGTPVDKKEAGKVILLRSDPEAPEDDQSIYRYDRAGLLMALKAASAGSGTKQRAGRGK
jgi:two-component system chemotaxis sensor kinase CheA